MSQTTTHAPARSKVPPVYPALTIEAIRESYADHLRARSVGQSQLSPRSVETYLAAADLLGRYLQEQGMPRDVQNITREHIEHWLNYLSETRGNSEATVSNRFRSIEPFFKWLISEGEIKQSPIANMERPTVHERPIPILSDSDVERLLKACDGTDFESKRDRALVRLLIGTGMRRAEIMGMTLNDWEHSTHTIWIEHAKGRRPRSIALGSSKASADLARYLRARLRHPQSHLDAMWLGKKGALTATGLAQLLRRRAKRAGLSGIHPHLFRHLFAHEWLAGGGSEGDLMAAAGWRTRTMLDRYGASARSDRAKDAARRLTIGDRF
jgi:site-specific recombinase XerD